jgi:hypothetical protein
LLADVILKRHRLYVFAVISHKTREIIRFAITENHTREFVRQQLMLFGETLASRVYLIHDNVLMFNFDFLACNLVSARTGVEAPNMNSIMERFFRTVRREALDNFLLIGRNDREGSGGIRYLHQQPATTSGASTTNPESW